jgi:hypothetical protein
MKPEQAAWPASVGAGCVVCSSTANKIGDKQMSNETHTGTVRLSDILGHPTNRMDAEYWLNQQNAETYALLFSAAPEAVYGPELVSNERFTVRVNAFAFGEMIRQTTGLEFQVMHNLGDGRGWRSWKGETPVQVIRRRWQ